MFSCIPGKTTLLKAIAKEGGIEGFPTHLRVLHVRQEVPNLSDDMSVLQAVIDADVERKMLLEQEKELLARLESAQGSGGAAPASEEKQLTVEEKRARWQKEKVDNAEFDKDLKELDEVYTRLQGLGSDAAEARAAMILSGLQFTPDMQTGPIKALSGGWQMRVALAAALFVEPDICLLDEPTNHLDLEAVLWLESYLQDYRHTLIVVSHDRGFLNEVCTDIIQFKKKKLTCKFQKDDDCSPLCNVYAPFRLTLLNDTIDYRGNYDTYVKLRDANIRNAMRVYQAYQEKRSHMMEFIEKFRANAKRATMVQSRIKTVEKMDAEAPEPVEIEQVWRFSIPNSEPLGRPIISVDDVCFDYSPETKSHDEYLLQKVNFGVDLTSKIAILGANGQGMYSNKILLRSLPGLC